MRGAPGRGFEPWAWGAFALGGLGVGLFLYLGSRPGGEGPILVYRYGLLVLGWVSAVGMLGGLVWSLRRRPVLQRRRAWPLATLGATLWFCSLPIAYPSSHDGRFSPRRFRLPFQGEATVRYGGEHWKHNPLVFDPARRFGFGFVAQGGSGSLAVLAPCAATVVDHARGRAGEGVVLAVGEHEYFVLEGLDEGSFTGEAGERVQEGKALGSASGVLYAHLQDRPEAGEGEGIPMRFWWYRVEGRLAESGVPVPPQAVAAEAAGGPGGAAGAAGR